MKTVMRWCRNCGQRKPLKDFDQVDDSLRRFCCDACKDEWETDGPKPKQPKVWFP